MSLPFQAMLLVGTTCYILTAILFSLTKHMPRANNGIAWWAASSIAAAMGCTILLIMNQVDHSSAGNALHSISLILWITFLHIGCHRFLELKDHLYKVLGLSAATQALILGSFFIMDNFLIASILVSAYCGAMSLHIAYSFKKKNQHTTSKTHQLLVMALIVNGIHWFNHPVFSQQIGISEFIFFFGSALSVVINTLLATLILYRFKSTMLRSERYALNVAMQDTLTGLSNRLGLDHQFKEAVASAQKHKTNMALLYIDLDNFKPINDQLGHQAGDQVLRSVADRMKSIARISDITARIGGDEFIIILTNLNHVDNAQLNNFIHRLISSVNSPIMIDNKPCKVGMSLGISRFPHQSESLQGLLNIADEGMYADKATKKHKARNRQAIQLPTGSTASKPNTPKQVVSA